MRLHSDVVCAAFILPALHGATHFVVEELGDQLSVVQRVLITSSSDLSIRVIVIERRVTLARCADGLLR